SPARRLRPPEPPQLRGLLGEALGALALDPHVRPAVERQRRVGVADLDPLDAADEEPVVAGVLRRERHAFEERRELAEQRRASEARKPREPGEPVGPRRRETRRQLALVVT